mmetsp:Transcript_11916/g.31512  ORF Transcript_11916/g.31512 Transcript_11916/m.31512 type:complete len:280 (-) Transcript_11916:39-878(-)
MEDPARDVPGQRRPSVTSDERDVGLTSLPDSAIHRISDFLRGPVKKLQFDGYEKRLAEFGSQNQKRAALSHTCRRVNMYYLFQYVTSFSAMIDFAKVGLPLDRFPLLDTSEHCIVKSEVPTEENDAYQRILHIIIAFRCNVATVDRALCVLAHACPSLRSLELCFPWKSSRDHYPSLVVLGGVYALRNLEILVVYNFQSTAEGIVWVLRGRNKLRVLELYDTDDSSYSFDPETVRAVPLSIERLRLFPPDQRDESGYNQCLQIMGGVRKYKRTCIRAHL